MCKCANGGKEMWDGEGKNEKTTESEGVLGSAQLSVSITKFDEYAR